MNSIRMGNTTSCHAQAKIAVLLVDDDPNVLSSLVRNFRGHDFSVYSASSAETALKVLEERNLDVVVTDICMPGMGGLGLLEVIVERWPDIMSIALTGNANLPDTMDAINKGRVYMFLEKPWSATNLRDTVQAAFAYKQNLSESKILAEQMKTYLCLP